jgi:hypothetical protein
MAPVPGAGRQRTARRLRPDWAEFACCRSERRLRAERAARLPMSALGQKRTSHQVRVMSALPPKANVSRRVCEGIAQRRAEDGHCSIWRKPQLSGQVGLKQFSLPRLCFRDWPQFINYRLDPKHNFDEIAWRLIIRILFNFRRDKFHAGKQRFE